MEIWKSISGWEGIYEISSHGRLKSFKKSMNGYVLSNVNVNGDYFSVVLKSKGKVRYTRIHRLVAEAFLMNPAGFLVVNHKDGNKQNNNIHNLEWCSCKQNVDHAIKMNPNIIAGMVKWNTETRPTPVMQLSIDGVFISEFKNCKDAGRITGICSRNIHQVASAAEYKPGLTRKQAGGYVWKYKSESI